MFRERRPYIRFPHSRTVQYFQSQVEISDAGWNVPKGVSQQSADGPKDAGGSAKTNKLINNMWLLWGPHPQTLCG